MSWLPVARRPATSQVSWTVNACAREAARAGCPGRRPGCARRPRRRRPGSRPSASRRARSRWRTTSDRSRRARRRRGPRARAARRRRRRSGRRRRPRARRSVLEVGAQHPARAADRDDPGCGGVVRGQPAQRVEEVLRLGLQPAERGRHERAEEAGARSASTTGSARAGARRRPQRRARRRARRGRSARRRRSWPRPPTPPAPRPWSRAARGSSARAIVHQTSGSTPSERCVERTSTWRTPGVARSRHARQSTTPSRRV